MAQQGAPGNDILRQKVDATVELMESIMDDTTVPRNIRKTIDDARQKIASAQSLDVNVSTAIYLMQDISNDINMPAHTRTEIWQIISQLEAIREQCKAK